MILRKSGKQSLMMIIVSIAILISCVFMGVILFMEKSQVVVSGNEGIPIENFIGYRFIIPTEKLPQKMVYALSGDPEAAEMLMDHYNLGIGAKNFDEGFKWQTIGVENGSLRAQYRYGGILVDFRTYEYDSQFESRTRGIYWLYIVVKNGYALDITETMLSRQGYTLDTAQPPGNDRFPDYFARFSEAELAYCKTGALQGNKKAALLLGKYYAEIAENNELSEYWYRIGAQNGSPECQYKTGQLLSGKNNEFDQIRGRFWFNQAAKNGYK